LLTVIAVVALVLVTVMYAAVPLLARRQVDPLPDERNPLLVDLEEERDALLRAIRELDGRDDLAAERRDALRARYESKAARVLKALEAYHANVRIGTVPTEHRTGPRRAPIGALSLLAIAVAATASLGSFVLPRVGQGTVTTFFADDLRAAEALRDLIRAADRAPTVANLMALGDAYWQLSDPEGAERSYRRVLDSAGSDPAGTGLAPALAYQRLALLSFETDMGAALDLLRTARRVDPADPETLYGIAELSFAVGDLDAAAEAFRAYLATPTGAADEDAAARLSLVEALAPAAAALELSRDLPNLMAMADVFWSVGAMDPAAQLYVEVLSQHDPLEPTATSRMGQFVFTRGRTDDAIALLERAAGAAGGLSRLEPQASLFLGNAYSLTGDDAAAVRAWEVHVETVGPSAAGRVPGLIEAARGRLAGGGEPDGTPSPSVAGASSLPISGAEAALAALDDPQGLLLVGDTLYQAHCAVCHGSTGRGGAGPNLVGNARAGNEANVRSLVRFGRGVMPGFGAILAEAEIEVLVRWVGQELAAPR
jgi:mono/diheme cytochrome c family protein/cytochrome c-type biogenesis protein CcmH/NrfG